MEKQQTIRILLIFILLFSTFGHASLSEPIKNDGSAERSEMAKMTKDLLVGDWKDTPGGECGNFYCFYSDGGFKYIFDTSWDALDPRINMEGTWKLEDNIITISISSLLTQENAVLNYDYSTGYHFEDGVLVTDPLGTALVREYTIGSLYEEKTESDEYYKLLFKSKWTMIVSRPFECLQLWKYSDIPTPRNESEEAAYQEAVDAWCEW